MPKIALDTGRCLLSQGPGRRRSRRIPGTSARNFPARPAMAEVALAVPGYCASSKESDFARKRNLGCCTRVLRS
eukprot:307829-Rhodomonas_salina.3